MTSAKQLISGMFAVLFTLMIFIVFMASKAPSVNFPNPPHKEVTTYALEEYSATVNEARIIEIYSGHAYQNHGSEVNKAFKCMKDNGTWKSFKTTGFKDDAGRDIPTNVWMCTDGKDFYAIITTIFQKSGGNQIAKLVTAYKVSKDVFPEIVDYINYIVTKWGAYEINYVIEKGSEIFLSPQ